MKHLDFNILAFSRNNSPRSGPAGWRAVERYLAARRAPATEAAYEACLGAFRAWAGETQVTPLPAAPETLALFLAGLADRGYAVPTLRRYVSAIGAAHIADEFDDPTKAPLIVALIDGIARERGTASEGKAALSLSGSSRIVAALPETRIGVRDRAILLLGFSSALRRGERAVPLGSLAPPVAPPESPWTRREINKLLILFRKIGAGDEI